jgi:hypothetical protein
VLGLIDRDLSKYLEESEENINDKDSDGRTALSWAAQRGDLLATILLVNYHANTEIPDNKGQMALHYAVSSQNLDVVRTLLEHGADPTAIKEKEATEMTNVLLQEITEGMNVVRPAGTRQDQFLQEQLNTLPIPLELLNSPLITLPASTLFMSSEPAQSVVSHSEIGRSSGVFKTTLQSQTRSENSLGFSAFSLLSKNATSDPLLCSPAVSVASHSETGSSSSAYMIVLHSGTKSEHSSTFSDYTLLHKDLINDRLRRPYRSEEACRLSSNDSITNEIPMKNMEER